MQADECDRQCVREPAQCSLRRRGRREITGPRDVTCVSYWAGARPLDSTTQDTGPRGAFCSRGVWGLPGCLSVRPAVKIHSFIAPARRLQNRSVMKKTDVLSIIGRRFISRDLAENGPPHSRQFSRRREGPLLRATKYFICCSPWDCCVPPALGRSSASSLGRSHPRPWLRATG